MTTSVPPAKSNPYGVAPEAAMVAGPSAMPSAPTAYVLMEFVPRSVTTSVLPSGLNAICAGSAESALSGRVESSSGAMPPASSVKPLMFGVPPAFST